MKTRPKVMVVDDSEVVLEMTRDALESAGHQVITRQRSAGTIGAVIDEQPDLVLLDVRMPGFSGDTIASILTKAAARYRPVVVLYSSCAPDELSRLALATGADGFIVKTGNVTHLVKEVTRYLSSKLTGSVSVALSTQSVRIDDRSPYYTSAPSQSGSFRRAPRVLFVDDDLLTISTYQRALSDGEFIGECVDSVEQAIRRVLGPEPPDVVVCDPASTDESSGIAFYERALAHDSSWRKRFVFVTHATMSGHIAGRLEREQGQILYKPVGLDALKQAVRFASIAARVFTSRKPEDAEYAADGTARRRT